MQEFLIDSQLQTDCHHLGQLDGCELLLMNNALFPWLILVPHSEHTEFYLLDSNQQQTILEHINSMSHFIKQQFGCDKLNIASIGNVVSQLHIHIVGRSHDDACWPGVVWGTQHHQPYTDTSLIQVQQAVVRHFGNTFKSTSQHG